jgi:sulfhydrogenase subunit beta (sulfur reductase)
MAREYIVHKKDFDGVLSLLIKDNAVFGPSGDDDGSGIRRIETPEQFKIKPGTAHFSFKHFLLPQSEILFSFDPSSQKIDMQNEGTAEREYNILIGLRPCDAQAVELLDQVFVGRDPKDVFYSKRRNKTKIISFACNEPRATCFCGSVGCGPDNEAGADVMVFELKDRYVLKTITQSGKDLLDNTGMHLDPASEKDLAEKEQRMVNARNLLIRVFSDEDLNGQLGNFEASVWQNIHQKCLGCGICTYFCPTCHCFDITDEADGTRGRRIRTWDSCMYPLFTMHASGHNPRPTRKERLRQRIMHKFVYSLEQYGKRFCVGCGRCVINCPVNLDLRSIIKEITEAK